MLHRSGQLELPPRRAARDLLLPPPLIRPSLRRRRPPPRPRPAPGVYYKPPRLGPLTEVKAMQWHSRLGTATRSSSRQVERCQTRMKPTPQVANTSLYSYGKASPLILSEWAVWMSSSFSLMAGGQGSVCVGGVLSTRYTVCRGPYMVETGDGRTCPEGGGG
jgi:hypothetical protein